MTREEAIKILRREIECLSHSRCRDCILEKVCDPNTLPLNDEYIEAYEMAINSLEQEPKTDVLDKIRADEEIHREKEQAYMQGYEDACKKYRQETKAVKVMKMRDATPEEIKSIYKYIKSISKPTGVAFWDLEQEPKTGRWVKISPADIYECSECGQNVMTAHICVYKYCHGCGAKMEGEEL